MTEDKEYTKEEICEILEIGITKKKIKRMKKEIANYCDVIMCDECLIRFKCPRGYKEPWIGNCDDWKDEEIIKAYKCMKGVE